MILVIHLGHTNLEGETMEHKRRLMGKRAKRNMLLRKLRSTVDKAYSKLKCYSCNDKGNFA